MKREISLYLDLLRFLAALVVFVQHFAWHHFSGGLFWQIGPYGAQAVIVFFVLSGYVIGYVTDRPGSTARDYALDRAARIYSVALPALLLTFVLDEVGRHLRPELYVGGWINTSEPIFSQILTNGLFLNQVWFIKTHPGSNVPWWSMGYEVWYYVAFGFWVFLPRLWGVLAALAVMVAIGPRVAAMFLVWLAGVGVYHLNARGRPRSRAAGIALFVGAPLLWAGFEAWLQTSGLRDSRPLSDHGWTLWQDGMVGLAVAAHLLGMNAAAPAIGRLLVPCEAAIRWLAGRSFTLYLMQVPVLQFLLVLSPWPGSSWMGRLLIVCGTLAIVALLAEVTERRKKAWRRLFEFMLPRLLRSDKAALAKE